MTTLELLVSIGVIGLLAAILLPAVQSTRAKSHQVACLNNLRQLAHATNALLSVTGKYPRSVHVYPEDYVGPRDRSSVHAQLLPYLDQQTTWDRLDLFEDHTQREPPTSDANAFALSHPIPVFVCPADGVPAGGNSYRACRGTTTGIHATWSTRGRPTRGPLELEGLWGISLAGRTPAKVLDGLSHTALFSERVVGDGDPQRYDPWTDVASTNFHNYFPNDAVNNCATNAGSSPHLSFLGWSWLKNDYNNTTYNHVLAPNARIPDCFDNADTLAAYGNLGQGAMTARSNHAGGVNLALADGAVRFVSQSIDLLVWRGLATIDGREVLDGY